MTLELSQINDILEKLYSNNYTPISSKYESPYYDEDEDEDEADLRSQYYEGSCDLNIIARIPDYDGLFFKITKNMDSYGSSEFISNISIVQSTTDVKTIFKEVK